MLLGTAVKIETTITVSGDGSVDSATIDINDPDGDSKVDGTAMTDDGDGVYSYLYQSATDDQSGTYEAIIEAVSGAYTGRARIYFTLHGESD